MNPHQFGDIDDHYLRCKRCGFRQYAAGPGPVLGCISDDELDNHASFLVIELKFLEDRLSRYAEKYERFWKQKGL